ncbi:MAG: pirin-like C-terminal cupin domain-containing protein, partial [Paludibacteraceae bacterium]
MRFFFENKGTDITLRAETNAVVLVLSGEPIRENIFAYGPFVMNTRD